MKTLGLSTLSIFLLVSMIGYGIYTITNTSNTFPVGTNFIVNEGESLRSISNRLEQEGFIASAFWFRAWISFTGKDRNIQLGEYDFSEALSLQKVVTKLVSEKPDKPLIILTVPEGSTLFEIASLVQKLIPTISVESFINTATERKVEGKLFPSTYYLLPSATAESIIFRMVETFEQRYSASLKDAQFPEPLTTQQEVLSLAAILEGEAKTEEDMRIIAGILLSRMKKGMPLQVDVAMETYKTKSLPPIPINNPGMTSLGAIFNQIPSPYLYYITGKDGKMYYAKTFEEHKRNIQKYLR